MPSGRTFALRDSEVLKQPSSHYCRNTMERETLITIPPDVGPVTHVRSASICAVGNWLRANHLFDDYACHFKPSELHFIANLTPSQWVPFERAIPHYHAIDRANLSDAQRKEAGGLWALKVHKNVIDI